MGTRTSHWKQFSSQYFFYRHDARTQFHYSGLGLYPTVAFLNHSCAPNCIVVFDGPKCNIRNICKIEKDQELCISYTELLRPPTERRQYLKEHYYFDCWCSRCLHEVKYGTEMNAMKCRNDECKQGVGFRPGLFSTCWISEKEIEVELRKNILRSCAFHSRHTFHLFDSLFEFHDLMFKSNSSMFKSFNSMFQSSSLMFQFNSSMFQPNDSKFQSDSSIIHSDSSMFQSNDSKFPIFQFHVSIKFFDVSI